MFQTLKRVFTLTCATFLVTACDNHKKPADSYKVAARGLHSAAISPDAQHIVVGSIYHGGSLWDHQNRERLYNWNHQQGDQSTIFASDISDDGNWALTAESHTLVLWDIASGAALRYFTAPGEVLDMELGPGGNTALLGLSDHNAVIFNIRRGGVLRTFSHLNRVRSVDISADGSLALTGSEDYTANLWKVNDSQRINQYKHDDDVQLVRLSNDGEIALSVSKYDRALLWNTNTGDIIGELPIGKERLKRGLRYTTAKFNHDNALLLTGTPNQIIELWNVKSLTKIASWKIPKKAMWKPTSAAVLDVEFVSDNQFVAVASNGFVYTLSLGN